MLEAAFPARNGHVICVNAFNSFGTYLAPFNPAISEGLGTLGVAVPAIWPGHKGPKAASGTSMATPIMAGIAALSIQFVRQLIQEPPPGDMYVEGVWSKVESLLRERDGMMLMLGLFTGRSYSRNRFVQPQLYFNSRTVLAGNIWEAFMRRLSPTTTHDTLSISSMHSSLHATAFLSSSHHVMSARNIAANLSPPLGSSHEERTLSEPNILSQTNAKADQSDERVASHPGNAKCHALVDPTRLPTSQPI